MFARILLDDSATDTGGEPLPYPRKCDRHLAYGTSGFRDKAHLLDHVLFRTGLLAVLRSKEKRGAAVGLVVTASHNAECDNGTKIIDPAGEMLDSSWEEIATLLANVDDRLLISTLRSIVRDRQIDLRAPATVLVGRDTRKSGTDLSAIALQGVRALDGVAKFFGVVTTPQLHYLVACTNDPSYGHPTIRGYYEKLAGAFNRIRGIVRDAGSYVGELRLDAANGVGAIAAHEFRRHLGTSLAIRLYNDGTEELNYMCGADYVKIEQTVPRNTPCEPLARCASLDGDADRIVYFYTDRSGVFHLLDGDRIATLVADYFKELLDASRLPLRLGLVQTAYANGESTRYISDVLRVPVACVSTGVKHLQRRAMDFDVGIYFEANGHGSVLFNDRALQAIRDCANDQPSDEPKVLAASKLRDLVDVINQTVGDALSDMLLVETILRAKRWSVVDWRESYEDLPNKQVKIRVRDRNVVKTTDAERRCVFPLGLQTEIDKIVAEYPRGRSFVRPSGTEDVVRVYAECQNFSDLQGLVFRVALIVYRMADGVGPEPTLTA